MSNFAVCANLVAAAGSNGFAGCKLYDEKEQSTDSTATDVGKDFNGRVKGLMRSRPLVATPRIHGRARSARKHSAIALKGGFWDELSHPFGDCAAV